MANTKVQTPEVQNKERAAAYKSGALKPSERSKAKDKSLTKVKLSKK